MPDPAAIAAVPHSDFEHRALLVCVGISVALHLLVLLSLTGQRAGVPASGPKILTARFAPRPASPEPAAAVEQIAPAGAPQPQPSKAMRETKAAVRQPPPVKSAPVLPAVPVPAVSAPSAPAQQSASAAPAAPARAAEAQAPAQGESAAKPGADAADSGTLDQYRLALIAMAKRYKRYPAQAMEKGWQGRVEIRMVIGANGMTRSVSVKVSSGFPILDDQAMEMLKKAKPLTQIPPALRGREFTVDVPVLFDLQTG